MNYIWTEKQIQSALLKLKDKKGWLSPHDHFRGFKRNATVEERRELMRILVESHGAFDNGKSHFSKEYCISFDHNNKEQLLPQQSRHFPEKLILELEMSDFPPQQILYKGEILADFESLVGRSSTTDDFSKWATVREDWLTTFSILRTIDRLFDGSLTHFKYQAEHLQIVRDRRVNVADLEAIDKNKALTLRAIELFCMYEALEVGWSNIRQNLDVRSCENHDHLFLELARIYSFTDFIHRCRRDSKVNGLHTNHARLKQIVDGLPVMRKIMQIENSSGILSNYLTPFEIKDLNAYHQASESLNLFKGAMTPELLEYSLIGSGYYYRRRLLMSSDWEVKNKAMVWENVLGEYYPIAKRVHRRIIEKKTSTFS